MATVNPYMPPNAFVSDVSTADSNAESIRQEYISHESSVRSIGTLYYIGGVITLVAAFGLLTMSVSTPEMRGFGGAIGVFYALFGVLGIAVARGLRQLKSWARTTAIVFSCLGLLGIPVGTLIHGYFLYLLLSEKGKRIFEADYADIVAATPHIKGRTSIIVWILVVLMVIAMIGIVAAIVIPMMAGR